MLVFGETSEKNGKLLGKRRSAKKSKKVKNGAEKKRGVFLVVKKKRPPEGGRFYAAPYLFGRGPPGLLKTPLYGGIIKYGGSRSAVFFFPSPEAPGARFSMVFWTFLGFCDANAAAAPGDTTDAAKRRREHWQSQQDWGPEYWSGSEGTGRGQRPCDPEKLEWTSNTGVQSTAQGALERAGSTEGLGTGKGQRCWECEECSASALARFQDGGTRTCQAAPNENWQRKGMDIQWAKASVFAHAF